MAKRIAAPIQHSDGNGYPSDWQIVRIGDLLTPVDVRVGDAGNSGLPILSIARHYGLILQTEKFGKRVASRDIGNYKLVRRGQIVCGFPMDEGVVFALRDFDSGAVSPVYNIWEKTSDRVNLDFLDILLKAPFMIDTYQMLSTNTVQRRRLVSKADFRNISVCIPDVPEQRAIAQILRTVQRAKEATEKVVAATRQLKTSLMRYLFTYGPVPVEEAECVRLKEGEIGVIPEHWKIGALVDSLREPLRNGHSARATNTSEGIRTLILTAVTKNDFSIQNTKLTVAEPDRVRDLWLKPGDILIERANTPEYIGLAALYEGKEDYAIFPDLMVRVRAEERLVRPRFLAEFLLTEPCRNHFRSNARATTGNFPKIDHGTIERTRISMPPIDEQDAITHALLRVEVKAKAERSRARCLEILFSSLLHHLMTGKVRVRDLDPTDHSHDGTAAG